MTSRRAEAGRALRMPLRVRLTLAFAVGMASVLGALGAFIYLRLGAVLLDGVDRTLLSRAEIAAASDNGGGRVSDGGLVDPDEAFGQVLERSGRILSTTSAVAAAPVLSGEVLRSVHGPTFFSERLAGSAEPARLLAVPGPDTVLVVGATLGDREDALHSMLLLDAVAGPAALAVSSLAGWILAGAALSPVERMRTRAEDITRTGARARLPVPSTGDELSRLATTLNVLLERMQDALEREHRFVDYASHELRTPLAILKAELDLAASRPRTGQELSATVAAAARETDRLVRLAQDLLVLARVRQGALPVRRVAVDLPALLEATAGPFRSRAAAAGRSIHVTAAETMVWVDPDRVRQAVHNLLDNALVHGRGPVTLTGEVRARHLLVEVRDSAPGFPVRLLDTAFEPFTKATAHVPAGGDALPGTGLGLAVVQAVAQAHGGTATAGNTRDGGGYVRLDLGIDPGIDPDPAAHPGP